MEPWTVTDSGFLKVKAAQASKTDKKEKSVSMTIITLLREKIWG
jgi:hypothetical protein